MSHYSSLIYLVKGKLTFVLEVILGCSPCIFLVIKEASIPLHLLQAEEMGTSTKKMTRDTLRTLLLFISWTASESFKTELLHCPTLALHILVHHQTSSRPEKQSCLSREGPFLFLHSSCSPLAVTKSDSVPATKRI